MQRKKVIVTGCRGQLGIAVNKLYAGSQELELVNTDVEELDITNIDKVMEFVRAVKPYAIINCAAHTNVNACETDVDNAYKINAIGPRNLSIAAAEMGAKLMQISTDYVFAGNGNRPYVEFDATNPLGLYGDGKNFVKTMLRLSETHDKVRVVGDQVGNPTSADELAKAIACLLPTENYGIFHGTCEGFCSWADFTKEIFRLAGKATEVEEITTEEYMKDNPASAARPSYSVLDNYRLRLTTDFQFADWHDAIEAYLKNS